MKLPSGRNGSWEEMLHNVTGPGKNVVVLLKNLRYHPDYMMRRYPTRAVGVVYDPKAESYGNYVPSIIPLRYDLFLFFDKTHALHPLALAADVTETPDTYPWGV